MMASHRLLTIPAGPMHLAADAHGLTHAVWLQRDHGRPAGDGSAAAARIIDQACGQLEAYCQGRRDTFNLPLSPAGTPFQQAVWQALAEIPWGQTSTYGALAAALGRPRAVRAVGTAVGANPLSIVLPCHRIIGSNGALRGYAGGLPAKAWLLAREGMVLL